jgi:PAS domain S-box-containing protein
MANAQILIVEDEEIIAADIKSTLEELGYTVSAVVSSGKEAVQKASETAPDLVLMDTILKGDMDGIEAAKQIQNCFSIPVVYLTASADDNTLQRAKISDPYGYVLKPLDVRELHISIEIALYKHKTTKRFKESEQQLATITRCMGDGMIVTDARGMITFMNPIAEALTGWKHEEASGRNLIEVFNLTENPIKEVLSGRDVTNLANYTTLITREGTELSIENNIAPIKDDKGGSVIGAVMAFRDITERKKIEENFLQSEKYESLKMTISGITNEFKNILAIIQGNAQLLKTSYGEHKGLTNRLSIISKMISDGDKIIRRMKEFTNVKKDMSYFVPVCMRDLTRQSIRSQMSRWEDVASTKGITYSVNQKSLKKIPAILGNPSELKEVLINVINNAFEAMPDGGCLTARTWSESDNVFISISDTGAGMSEDVQKKIFDPFFTTKTPRRIGLGMSVAFGMMTRHGGKIEVKSEEGEGCTITLVLPIAAKKTTHPRKRKQSGLKEV